MKTKKFYNDEIFDILSHNDINIFDKNELLYVTYDSFHFTKGLNLNIYRSVLVFDIDQQAQFILNYNKESQALQSITKQSFSWGISYFKFIRELNKINHSKLEIAHIFLDDAKHSTFGLHENGYIKYFLDNNEWREGKELKYIFKDRIFDKELKNLDYEERFVYKTVKDIKDWLQLHHIKKYTIHPNLVVDVDCDVVLKDLKIIPIQFGKVNGNFNAKFLSIKDLSGFPYEVNGNVDLFSCNLLSLKGAPRIVNGNFDVGGNYLESFEFCPEYVKCTFDGSGNPLKTLKNIPLHIGEDFNIVYTRLASLDLKELEHLDIEGNILLSRRNKLKFKSFEHLYDKNVLSLDKKVIEQLLLNDKLNNDLPINTSSVKKMKI